MATVYRQWAKEKLIANVDTISVMPEHFCSENFFLNHFHPKQSNKRCKGVTENKRNRKGNKRTGFKQSEDDD